MTASSIATRLATDRINEPALRALTELLDLTSLDGRDHSRTITELCRRARQPCGGRCDPPLEPVAAVCVYPLWISAARSVLHGSSVRLATVGAGFPSGQYALDVRLADVAASVRSGIDEMDMVINRGHVAAGRLDLLTEDVRQVRATCLTGGVRVLKVILETCELDDAKTIRRTADAVIDAVCNSQDSPPPADGECFLKTSTGKGARGAMPDAARTMLDAIADHHRATGVRIGFKAAGGIRTVEDAMRYVGLVRSVLGEAWLTPGLLRIGASSLLDDIVKRLTHG